MLVLFKSSIVEFALVLNDIAVPTADIVSAANLLAVVNVLIDKSD